MSSSALSIRAGTLPPARLPWSQGEEVFLVSGYWDSLYRDIPEELRKLVREHQEGRIILCMDSNAHSPMWGCDTPNQRGEYLEEFIFDNGLEVCNKGRSPTFENRISATIIDITLCTSNMLDRVVDWEIGKRYHFSDHKRIYFRLEVRAPRSPRSWVLKSANWAEFRGHLKRWHRPPRYCFWTPDTVEVEVGRLYGDVEHALCQGMSKNQIREIPHQPLVD